jgi:LCP family protein required for cell wall assembly
LSGPTPARAWATRTGGREKVNAALARGPEQLVETIRADFGIPVSHYLLVDFDGFRALVDAAGGIRLDFPYPVRDDDNGHNNSGLLVATPGCRHLDGGQALALARSRYDQYRGADGAWHADSGYDLGRIRRQRSRSAPWPPGRLARGWPIRCGPTPSWPPWPVTSPATTPSPPGGWSAWPAGSAGCGPARWPA